MRIPRREFIGSIAGAGLGASLSSLDGLAEQPGRRWDEKALRRRFPDLSRHFVFEYYAWYGMSPVQHWDQWDRRPPVDLASNFMPRLGAYDSSSTKVMEQHAKWIRESGAGAINLSWWGRGSGVDRLVPRLMDVMAAHDVRVTFHLEPYRDSHALAYADDVEYLIRQYGDRRRWDAMLLLADESGKRGPVFKSFRTIVPSTVTDCHGRVSNVSDYADDATWRDQTGRVRATFVRDFDHVTLLADSLDWGRTSRSGFDGIAIYDNFVRPDTWRQAAEACTERDLLFSFNINPGFDGIVPRRVAADSCDEPADVEPRLAMVPDWNAPRDRDAARTAIDARIRESFDTSMALQAEPALANRTKGFLLAYINSFNEWHEGHQFEPMKDRPDLTPAERAVGYHNEDEGGHRLNALRAQLSQVL